MKVIDISWPLLPQITGYKDSQSVLFEHIKNFDVDKVRSSRITLNSHAGTHVDAPSHFIKDGKSIDHITLDYTIGQCQVLDLTSCGQVITKDNLEHFDIHENEIILLKTINSGYSPLDLFKYDFVYLDESGARYLTQKKVRAVGIDYLGIERSQPDHRTHINLMQNNVAIIEGLRLGHVDAGSYFLVCLPLAIVGLEAAPARAILIQE